MTESDDNSAISRTQLNVAQSLKSSKCVLSSQLCDLTGTAIFNPRRRKKRNYITIRKRFSASKRKIHTLLFQEKIYDKASLSQHLSVASVDWWHSRHLRCCQAPRWSIEQTGSFQCYCMFVSTVSSVLPTKVLWPTFVVCVLNECGAGIQWRCRTAFWQGTTASSFSA